jgi:hypothetical protein
MLEVMYDIPSRGLKECVISEDVVINNEKPILIYTQNQNLHNPRIFRNRNGEEQNDNIQDKTNIIPLLPLRDVVVFPHMIVPPLSDGRNPSPLWSPP